MIKTFTAFALVSLIAFSSIASADDKKCANTAETKELYFRALYTNFMIARDKCGTVNEYMQFMKTYKDDVLGNVSVLKKYYKRLYGRAWKKHMDAFMTKIANDISVGSNGDDYYKYCYHSWKMLHMMNNMPEGDEVNDYIHKYAEQYSQYLPNQCAGAVDFWDETDGDESKN